MVLGSPMIFFNVKLALSIVLLLLVCMCVCVCAYTCQGTVWRLGEQLNGFVLSFYLDVGSGD